MGFFTQPSFFIIEIKKPLLILWVCSFDHLWLRWVKPSQRSNSAQAAPTLLKEWKKKKKKGSVRNWQGILPLDSLPLESCITKPAFLSNFICLQGFIYHLLLTTFSHIYPCWSFRPPFNNAYFRGSRIYDLGWFTTFLHLAWPKGILLFCNHALQFLFLCYSG